MAWMALVIMRMIVHPPGGLLREAVPILPDTLRLIRGLAADPTLSRAVRIRLAPLRSESFVPSLLSGRPGSFFSFSRRRTAALPEGLVPSSPRSGPAGIGVSNGDRAPGAPVSRPTATTQICSETKGATVAPSAR
jgi:hypothetical protein